MREIPLTQGKVAIVDDCDYEALACHKWYAWSPKDKTTWYARRNVRLPNGRQATVFMHRVILGVPPGVEVDHENHDGLDNRRENIRACAHIENSRNKVKRAGTSSRFVGVAWQKDCGRWRVQISHGPRGQDGRSLKIFLGLYSDETAAALAYDDYAREAFGAFAHLNFQ